MTIRSSVFIGRVLLALSMLVILVSPQVNPPVLASPAEQYVQPQDEGPLTPAAPGDHLVTFIYLTPDTPNILRTNQDVNISFDYITNQPEGVRIFIRPFTNGSLTPDYAAHPSPLYPAGSGKGSGYFTITTGTVEVDQIRIRVLNADQSVLLFETFLPVYFLFTDSAHVVYNLDLSPDTPDVLAFDQDVDLTFDYLTRNQTGVRIWARPFTNGQLTPNYGAHGSGIYPAGQGSGSGFFTITSGQVVVDQIRIQMWDPDQTVLLFEAFLPVYYRFRGATNIVTDIEFSPDTPNIFKYADNINLTFNYNTNQAGGVRIWARPFSGANLSPGYAAHGSPIYPVGSGSGTGSFRLTTGPLVVDKVRIQMWDANQTVLLYEAFLPVHLLWAGSGPPPGPDMQINAIEVTQAIQDLNNSVDLVAGKRTYVRMHVSSPVNIADVYATLSGKRGIFTLNPVLNPGNPGSDITVRTNPDRGQINDSFWFELPAGWTTAGNLTLTARLDPNGAKFDPDTSDNIRIVTVNFQETPPLRLRLINVQYTAGGTTYLAANSHLDALESWLRREYPIHSLQVSRQTFTYPDDGLPNVDTLHGWMALGKLFRILFAGEDSRTVYYGMVDDGGGFMRGKAAGIPSTIAAGPTGTGNWGWDYDGSYGDWYGAHEIGHTRGRYHAEFCGAGGGVPYPYPNGRISPDLTGNDAIYGFDITTRAIYPPTWTDLMTYCDYEWISDFSYEGIRDYIVGIGQQTVQATVTADQFLMVMGFADLAALPAALPAAEPVSNTVTLESVYLLDQPAEIALPEQGDWLLVLLNADGKELAVYPFQPDELTDPDQESDLFESGERTDATQQLDRPAVIAEIIPWSEGAVQVQVRYAEQVVASSNASANAPTVVVTSPQPGIASADEIIPVAWEGSDLDGDPLIYTLLYSNDSGDTWQTLATGLEGTQFDLDTDQIPGGSALLRVVASDGFLSGQGESSAFTVPNHAPLVEIILPGQDQTFFPTQQVILQGTAYDLEDGMLDDAAFLWTSSLDGDLGNGALLSTSELTTGTHLITLMVIDSGGLATQVTRTIRVKVVADNDFYLPLISR